MKKLWPLCVCALITSVPAFAGQPASMHSVRMLSDVDVSGVNAYGGTSGDDDGTSWESMTMRDGKVGGIAVDRLSVVTDLRFSGASSRYVGHSYRRVSAHCKSARIVEVAGRTIADADQCRIKEAIPK